MVDALSDRKKQILELTAELLQTKVFSSFSYQDIAERLGITKAAVHSHFKTKEILGCQLIDDYIETGKELQEKADRAGPGAWDRYNAFIKGIVKLTVEENKICSITVLQAEYCVLPESMCHRLDKIYELDRAWLSDVLQQGRDTGEMHYSGTPRDKAAMLLAVIDGAQISSRANGFKDFEKIIKLVNKEMTKA